MKNKTYFKKQNKVTKTLIITIAVFTLFLAGCFDFENIYQPYHADPNSYFDVQVSAWAESHTYNGHIPHFGVLLPVGWEPQDSIAYFDSNSYFVGTLIYSDSLSQSMSAIDPPPDNYYWWVAHDVIGIGGGTTYNLDLRIFTDAQTGTFFIDYMLGSDGEGLNYRRSNDHQIIIGDIQGCAPEGIVLTTQAEVDSFQVNYPGCSELAGDLTINGEDITNLIGLDSLCQIGGSLRIEQINFLLSLTGLENLTSVGGGLYLSGNWYTLTSLSGLENLTSIGRDLVLSSNYYLTSLTSLENLTSIGGDLVIWGNALTSLSGLENLNSIGGNLFLSGNPITSLSGLENLTSIGGGVNISDNWHLTSLSGLENIATGSITNLYIYENDLLSTCDVRSICGYLAAPNGTIEIHDNAPGCNSPEEVEEACESHCLYDGITFSSQAQIDNFQINHLGCSEIEGNVLIQGYDITNLNGLNLLTSIGGDLEIIGNDALTSLTGLENLASIGGDLDLSGNDDLTSLTALENLSYIRVALVIENNTALTSLTGLENLSSFGGSLQINSNTALTSLSGLENLSSIGGDLDINYNDALTSLSGLENLAAESITNLHIYANGLLSTCEVQSICEYLASPNGTVSIYDNGPGCNSPEEVEEACESHCLYDGITFSSQAQIDNFQINHPGCNEIEGDVEIDGNDITNLNGLNLLTSIDGDLFIVSTDVLISLSGLENLSSIGGNSYIRLNNALTSLSGLENLTSIDGILFIHANTALNSLMGLENLTSIGGDLKIYSNDALTSLTGLDNVTPGSIENLNISNNSTLSNCAVESICDYLAAPYGIVLIYNNAPGCNSPEEVEEACLYIFIPEIGTEPDFNIYPSPVGDFATMSFEGEELGTANVLLYNSTGIKVKTWRFKINSNSQNDFVLDFRSFPAGMYLCKVQIGDHIVAEKIVKQ